MCMRQIEIEKNNFAEEKIEAAPTIQTASLSESKDQ